MLVKKDKPWGFELIEVFTELYVVKKILIKASHRLSLQHHEKKEETVFVLGGKLHLYHGFSTDNLEKTILEVGECFHIKPGYIHRFCADELEDTLLLEISTTQLDDVVRHEDDYGRV